jgi:hypothetical protein
VFLKRFVMNVAKVKELCAKRKQNFIFNEEENSSEEEAFFYFVGNQDGEEVVFNSYLYPLESEYMLNLMEESIQRVIQKYPNYKPEDFDMDQSGPHIELLEEVLNELSEDEELGVQEFVEIGEAGENGVELNICLNVPQINSEVISKFVSEFNSGKLELDTTVYSFSIDESYEED